jgi:type VI secretion system protein ImpI
MILHLTIENETSLPDGGPLSTQVQGPRGIDIGRDAYLDWTLPDPTRTISGKHCEIRFRDGGYWLHDVSRNGTFLNRSDQRIAGPHRLRDGDRLEIGRYIIAARIEGEEAGDASTVSSVQTMPPDDYWLPTGGEAAPISARDLQPVRERRPVHAGFDEWVLDLPAPEIPHASSSIAEAPQDRAASPTDVTWSAAGAPSSPDDGWATATPASPVLPPSPAPTPRRPGPAPAEEASRRQAPGLSVDHGTAIERGAQTISARLASGLGVPAEIFDGRDPEALVEELGTLLRLVVENLMVLLMARAESKRATRATQQTMIQALDNNPLKFSPAVEDALRIMFVGGNAGYLDARQALEQSFRDLKVHQIKTYAAMQNGLRLLLQDLEPEAIEEAVPAGGIGDVLGSRRARLWDTYVTRWNATTAPYESGMTDAFMTFFAECYDRGGASH